MSSNSSIHNVSKVEFTKMDLGDKNGHVFVVTATDESGHEHTFNMFASEVIQDANEIKWRDFKYE